VGGLWLFVIGSYLQNASRSSYLRLFVSETFQGETVRRFMKADPVTVSPSLSIRRLVQEYIYRYHYKMFPVVEGSTLVGCVTSRMVRDIPPEEWDRQTVGDLLSECSTQNTIGSAADAMDALSKMNRTGNSRLMVVDEGQLVGVVTLKDMLEFLSLKMNLEGRR
jgi:predicted transcriptional regulator